MKTSHLTNEEIGKLLWELQAFWKKWRDTATNTDHDWGMIIYEANRIYDNYGDSSADLIASFIKQIEYRVIPEQEEQEENNYTH